MSVLKGCCCYVQCLCRQEILGLLRRTALSAASVMEATSCVNRGSAALHRSVKLLKEFWAAIPQVK